MGACAGGNPMSPLHDGPGPLMSGGGGGCSGGSGCACTGADGSAPSPLQAPQINADPGKAWDLQAPMPFSRLGATPSLAQMNAPPTLMPAGGGVRSGGHAAWRELRCGDQSGGGVGSGGGNAGGVRSAGAMGGGGAPMGGGGGGAAAAAPMGMSYQPRHDWRLDMTGATTFSGMTGAPLPTDWMLGNAMPGAHPMPGANPVPGARKRDASGGCASGMAARGMRDEGGAPALQPAPLLQPPPPLQPPPMQLMHMPPRIEVPSSAKHESSPRPPSWPP